MVVTTENLGVIGAKPDRSFSDLQLKLAYRDRPVYEELMMAIGNRALR